MTCYCCSSKAVHAVNLKSWKPVCKFHSDEAIEEEGPVQIMTIERWEEQHERRTDVSKSLSIVNVLLALEAKKKHGYIMVDPADLQVLADEVKRLSKDE